MCRYHIINDKLRFRQVPWNIDNVIYRSSRSVLKEIKKDGWTTCTMQIRIFIHVIENNESKINILPYISAPCTSFYKCVKIRDPVRKSLATLYRMNPVRIYDVLKKFLAVQLPSDGTKFYKRELDDIARLNGRGRKNRNRGKFCFWNFFMVGWVSIR